MLARSILSQASSAWQTLRKLSVTAHQFALYSNQPQHLESLCRRKRLWMPDICLKDVLIFAIPTFDHVAIIMENWINPNDWVICYDYWLITTDTQSENPFVVCLVNVDAVWFVLSYRGTSAWQYFTYKLKKTPILRGVCHRWFIEHRYVWVHIHNRLYTTAAGADGPYRLCVYIF